MGGAKATRHVASVYTMVHGGVQAANCLSAASWAATMVLVEYLWHNNQIGWFPSGQGASGSLAAVPSPIHGAYHSHPSAKPHLALPHPPAPARHHPP